jgi:hypothetical protein
MNNSLPFVHKRVSTWVIVLILGSLNLLSSGAQAQLYYLMNDGAATTTLDQLRRTPLSAAAETTLTSNVVDSPGTLAVDLANNRILVASVRNNLPRIAAISLTAPYTVTTFLTPAPVNGAASSALAGIAIPGAPAPTTISSINRGSTNPSNAGSVTYTVVFAASVTGLTISNFSLVTSSVSGASINSLSGSGTTYTVSVNTGSGSGTLTLRLINDTGLSPRISTTLPFTGETYTIDKTAPIPTITSSAGTPTTTSPIPFTVSFSESVTGFVAGDLTVTNGTLSGFSGSGTTYTANVTPATPGVVTVNVPANVAQDAAGNGNTAAGAFSRQYQVPNSAPTDSQLSQTTIAENQPSGTTVGTLSSTDADVPAQTFVYALVSGSGDADNAAFSIEGTTLKTALPFDFETKASYSIRVRSTDSGTPAQSYESVFVIAVSNVNELTVSRASQTNVSCNGGSNGAITVTAGGETGPYTYDWSPGNPTGEGTATIQGLTAGTYTVVVTAASNATATTTVTITQPSLLVATSIAQTDVSCYGGSNGSASIALIGGTAPYTYAWSPRGGTGATASGLSAGNYSVTATDANGCTTIRNFTLVQPPALAATVSQTNVLRYGESTGSASITVSGGVGGYTYAWSPRGGTEAAATGLSADTYTVTVTDANSCTIERSFTLTQPAAPQVSIQADKRVVCGGSIQLTASSNALNATFNWTGTLSTSGSSVTVTSTGVYSVTVTDVNGSTATAAISVTVNALPSPTLVSSGELTCATPTVTLTAGGGTSYAFSPGNSPTGGSNTATVSSPGVYSVTVTDANGCQATAQTEVTQNRNLEAPALTASVASTADAPISVTATGCAGTLTWRPQGGSGTAAGSIYTVTQPGNYTLTATCTVGTCTSPEAAPLTLQIRPGGFAITGVNPVSCQLLDTGRGWYEVRFTPQYTGLSGTVSFAIVNELSPTTAPGPYTLRLYSDNPMITLVANQSGSPEARFVYHWLAACSAGTSPNRPPVARSIPDQTLPQGQAYSLELANYITDPDGQPLTFSATGLPADLTLSGSRISGTAATTGVSTITIKALDPAGLEVTTGFQFTVTPLISTSAGFTIVGVTTVSCQTLSAGQRQVQFLPQYGGVTGQPITFEVTNELVPTQQAGPYTLTLYTDNPVINLQATQTGSPTPATYRYNWLAGCGTTPTTPPSANRAPVVGSGVANQTATVGQGYTLVIPAGTFTDPDGDALTLRATGLPAGLSFAGSILTGTPSTTGVSTVSLTAADPAGLEVSLNITLTVVSEPMTPPTADFAITAVRTVTCEVMSAGQRRVSFTPQYSGVSSSPISFSVVNELSATTAPGPYSIALYTDNPVITLQAQQGVARASYRYEWLAACNARGRQSAPERSTPLRVMVLGNPVVGQQVRVEVRGAEGQALRLSLTDQQGRSVSDQTVERAASVEQQTLRLSQGSGPVLLLRVSTSTQSQTVKLINPN